jgi:hypothetical protein
LQRYHQWDSSKPASSVALASSYTSVRVIGHRRAGPRRTRPGDPGAWHRRSAVALHHLSPVATATIADTTTPRDVRCHKPASLWG